MEKIRIVQNKSATISRKSWKRRPSNEILYESILNSVACSPSLLLGIYLNHSIGASEKGSLEPYSLLILWINHEDVHLP